MKGLKWEDAADWLTKQKYVENDGRMIPSLSEGTVFELEIPVESRRQSHLARELSSYFSRDSALFLVRSMNVWPSEEFLTLASIAWEAFAETTEPMKLPGLLCNASDGDRLNDLIRMTFLSGWDANVLSTSGSVSMTLNHDGWLSICLPNRNESLHLELEKYVAVQGIGLRWRVQISKGMFV